MTVIMYASDESEQEVISTGWVPVASVSKIFETPGEHMIWVNAEYAGINIARNIILVMMLSGALAGLGGVSEVSGVVHRLQTSPVAAGYGFTGIIVAWLAKLNPFAIVLVSILFGALILAGREIQPSGISRMIQGIILVSLIASDFLMRYQIRLYRIGEEA